MNITDSANPQAHANTSTNSLVKPTGSIEDSKKSSPEALDKMTSDDLVALVNIIVILISSIRSPSAGGDSIGGSPFNSSSGSNFILDFPTLPTMNNSSEGASNGSEEGNSKGGNDSGSSNDSASGSSTSLNLPPLPSFNLGSSVNSGTGSGAATTNGSTGSTGSPENNSNGNANASDSGTILNTRPLPSLVSATGSLSTAGAPRAFNPPPIPSLLGNSTQLPSVNAADSALSTGQNTSPQSSSVAGSSAANTSGSTILNTNQLPSLVSATGSLSTPDSPKAFNLPPIPSLTGGSTELPLVSASDSKPITTGLSSSTNTPVNSDVSNSLSSSIFNVPAIPSLLGSGGTIDSLVASLQSGTSSSGSSSNANANSDQTSGGSGSHWKGGS